MKSLEMEINVNKRLIANNANRAVGGKIVDIDGVTECDHTTILSACDSALKYILKSDDGMLEVYSMSISSDYKTELVTLSPDELKLIKLSFK